VTIYDCWTIADGDAAAQEKKVWQRFEKPEVSLHTLDENSSVGAKSL